MPSGEINSNMSLKHQLPREETSAEGAELQTHRVQSQGHQHTSHTLWFQETPAPSQSGLCASHSWFLSALTVL